MLVTRSPGFDYLGGCTSLTLCIPFDLTSCLFINSYLQLWVKSMVIAPFWLQRTHSSPPACSSRTGSWAKPVIKASFQNSNCNVLFSGSSANSKMSAWLFKVLWLGWGRLTTEGWEENRSQLHHWNGEWTDQASVRPWGRLFSEALTGGLNSLSHQFRNCWMCQGGWGH